MTRVSSHYMPAYIYLGGDLELEVPVAVQFRAYPYVPGGYMDPPEGPDAEVVAVTRCDGLQWHDGCDAAFDAWWAKAGRVEALEYAGERGA